MAAEVSTYWDDQALTRGGRDATFHGIPWDEGTQQMVDLILPWLPDSGTVADLGCGVGRMAIPIGAARPDGVVVGVDSSKVMLDQAEQSSHVLYYHGGVDDLPFVAVKAAYSVLLIQHLDPEQVAAMFAEVRRVLVPGGRFVCQWVYGTHHAPNDHHYTMTEIIDAAGDLRLIDAFEGVHPDWRWGVWEA